MYQSLAVDHESQGIVQGTSDHGGGGGVSDHGGGIL